MDLFGDTLDSLLCSASLGSSTRDAKPANQRDATKVTKQKSEVSQSGCSSKGKQRAAANDKKGRAKNGKACARSQTCVCLSCS